MSIASNMIQPFFGLDTSAFKVTTNTLYSPSRMVVYELDASKATPLTLRIIPSPYTEWIIAYNDDDDDSLFCCIGLHTEYTEVNLKAYKHFFGIRFDERGAYFGKGADNSSYPALLKDTVSDYTPEKDSYEKMLVDSLRNCKSSKERLKAFTSYLANSKTYVPVAPFVNTLLDDIINSDGSCSILDFATKYGYSSRHITRIFYTAFGITPKDMAKLIRFQCVIKEFIKYPNLEIGKLISGYGFSDQSHFHREFKKFMNTTPKTFANSYREFLESKEKK